MTGKVLHVRSIWNGMISFGLVRVPVKLVNATESHAIPFREIHTEDGGRIRHRKFCELEDREVTAQEISRGYEEADGTIIPVTDEDLSHLPIPTARTIGILTFVPEDSIDPLQMGAAYYLAAGRAPAARPYALLREALRRSDKVAVAKFALRGRERLGMLRVIGDTIVLHGLLWPDEVRAPEGLAPGTDVTVPDRELNLADALVDALGGAGLEGLRDEYREAVEEVVAAKISGEALPEAPQPERGGRILDLTTALEMSLREARESRAAPGETAGGKPESAAKKRTPAKKTPQGKTPTGKPAAKAGQDVRKTTKAPTKKAPAKKAPAKKAVSRGRPA
ncbi:Ku protein [Streptomyces sp. NPDC016626]|uniref:non-homologous end joining protein Ku n=1 Tax=Streptomyces sp. NPDC016626 TaxID=3364968 RepID=UPI0036F8502C